MAKVKTLITNGNTVAAEAHATSPPCAHCGSETHGAARFALLSDHAISAMQQLAGLAVAQHRQFFKISPAEMMATGVTDSTPDSITLHLEGTLGAIPYNFDLAFTLDLTNEQLVVTFDVTQPVTYHGSWTFKLHPLSLGNPALPRYTGASLVAASLPEVGGAIGCILKCLGPQVITIVLECLPSLITGKQAFLACLVEQAQASLPGVMQCIQQCK